MREAERRHRTSARRARISFPSKWLACIEVEIARVRRGIFMGANKSRKPVKQKITIDGIERSAVIRCQFRFATNFARVDVEFQIFGRNLSARAARIWSAIRGFGDGSDDSEYFPSIAQIMERSGYDSRESIRLGLNELYRFKWLSKKDEWCDWEVPRKSNEYIFIRPVAKDREGEEWIFESPTKAEADAYRKENQ